MDDLTTALEITVVGMALVFGAILLLWGVMALLMRLTAEQATLEAQSTLAERERRRRAAAVAVAVALLRDAEYRDAELSEFPLPPEATVSAWQAVQRSRSLTQKGPRRR